MKWYLVHTKPRQEHCARENLERQGYECYLPTLVMEKLRRGELVSAEEALFPRYLFIRLSQDHSAKSWSPIRSTRGVSRLVAFGNEAAQVDEHIIESLKAHAQMAQGAASPLFAPGELVKVTAGPFAGLDAIYQMAEGERRVMVLIELMSRPVALRLAPSDLRKIK